MGVYGGSTKSRHLHFMNNPVLRQQFSAPYILEMRLMMYVLLKNGLNTQVLGFFIQNVHLKLTNCSSDLPFYGYYILLLRFKINLVSFASTFSL